MLAFSAWSLPPFLQPLPTLQPGPSSTNTTMGRGLSGSRPPPQCTPAACFMYTCPPAAPTEIQASPTSRTPRLPGFKARRDRCKACSLTSSAAHCHRISIRNPGSRGVTLIFSCDLSQPWPDTLVTRGESQIILHSPKQNSYRGRGEDTNWK